MIELKQSVAANVLMGPFLDDIDGKTAETALSIVQADIRLSKAGGDTAQTNNTAGATHDESGYYSVPLNSTDTNTLGRLRVFISKTGALPVWQDFNVVTANYYDSKYSTDYFDVNVVQVGGISQSGGDIVGVLNDLHDNHAPTADTIAAAVWNDLASGHTTAGTFGLYLGGTPTIGSTLAADIANVHTDVGTAITNIGDVHGTDLPALTTIVSNIHDTDLPAVKSDTAAIKTKTDSLTFTVANKVDSNVYTWSGTAVATPDTAGYPKVTIKSGTGTGEISLSSGLITLTAATIDAIWDELASGHATAGSFGKYLDSDISANTDHITADYTATEKAAIDLLDDAAGGLVDIHTDVGTLDTLIDLIVDIHKGKREITGNQLILYKADNTTEICRFNLFNANGDPAMIDITKRTKV